MRKLTTTQQLMADPQTWRMGDASRRQRWLSFDTWLEHELDRIGYYAHCELYDLRTAAMRRINAILDSDVVETQSLGCGIPNRR